MKRTPPASVSRGTALFTPVMLAAFLSVTASAKAQTNKLLSLAGLPPTPPASGNSFSPIISPDGRFVAFASSANNLVTNSSGISTPASAALVLNVYLRDRRNETTSLVSVNGSGTGGGNDNSWPVAISTNGQYVLFESAASNLVIGDANNANDVFVRDVVNGITTLVSVNTNGVPGNGVSRNSVMTPDGRFVAFGSLASDLVPGDTNAIADVFVRDLQAGITSLASPGAVPATTASNIKTEVGSDLPQITPDGRYVAFFSDASNLVAGVGTLCEIYVTDLTGGTTIQASVQAHIVMQANTGSTNSPLCCYNHRISDDGQYVVYQISPLINAASVRGGIARYSLMTGLTDTVTTNAYGYNLSDNLMMLSDISPRLDITPDGRFVAFIAFPNSSSLTVNYAYLWDGQSNTTALATTTYFNTTPSGSSCDFPVIDSTGRYLAFLCNVTNLTTNVTIGNLSNSISTITSFHLFLRDLQLGTNYMVDADTNGVGSISNLMCIPQMTPDARFLAFSSMDGAFTPGDNNHAYDVFVHDMTSNTWDLVSAHDVTLPCASPNGFSRLASAISISSNAQFVTFMSDSDNLAPNDTNGYRNIYVRDTLLGTNLLVDYSTNGVAGVGGPSVDPVISRDGRFVAFSSGATNLIANDTNKVADVFVRDQQTGTLTLVSISTNGGYGFGTSSSTLVNGAGASFSPLISGDGRYVVFHSTAQNLVSGGSTANENIFRRDIVAGTTFLLSTNSTANPMLAAMSPDGRFVVHGGAGLFIYIWDMSVPKVIYSTNSQVSALGISANGARFANMVSSGGSVVGVDLVAGTNILLGTALSSTHQNLRFSADGRYLVYVAANGTSTNQVWSYDFVAGVNLLVSKAYSSALGGSGNSDSPDITADGRFIAYRSAAANIVPGDNNNAPDVFLYDTANGTTILVSLSTLGNFTGNWRSSNPQFSPDGQTLLFQSSASDLAAQDFNQSGDIFALGLYSANPEPPFNVTMLSPVSGYPLMTWPAVPGRGYQVQFKNNLTDANWQSLTGNVTILGNDGFATDLAPAPQRFYRVVGR